MAVEVAEWNLFGRCGRVGMQACLLYDLEFNCALTIDEESFTESVRCSKHLLATVFYLAFDATMPSGCAVKR